MSRRKKSPGLDLYRKKQGRREMLQGISLGCVLGMTSPFCLQFASPVITLAGFVLGLIRFLHKPESVFWRSFMLSCALWFLINGSCAYFMAQGLSQSPPR